MVEPVRKDWLFLCLSYYKYTIIGFGKNSLRQKQAFFYTSLKEFLPPG